MTMHPPLEISVNANDGSASPSLSSSSSFKKPTLWKIPKGTDLPEGQADVKKVSFSKRVKIKKIRSHKLYSEAERDSIWHTDEEYSEIKRGCVRTLKLMMKSDFAETGDVCPRGLEVRTRTASAARKEIRLYASHVVFEEQENQAEWGETSDERIREAYLEISRDATSRAHFNGLRDEKIAMKLHGTQ